MEAVAICGDVVNDVDCGIAESMLSSAEGEIEQVVVESSSYVGDVTIRDLEILVRRDVVVGS